MRRGRLLVRFGKAVGTLAVASPSFEQPIGVPGGSPGFAVACPEAVSKTRVVATTVRCVAVTTCIEVSLLVRRCRVRVDEIGLISKDGNEGTPGIGTCVQVFDQACDSHGRSLSHGRNRTRSLRFIRIRETGLAEHGEANRKKGCYQLA